MIFRAVLYVLFFNFLHASPLSINCEDGNIAKSVESCIHPFKTYYEEGVGILTQVNSSTVDLICSKYEEVRSCLVMYMHFCPDIRKRLNFGVKNFEYACTADRMGEWPYSPTIIPFYEIDEEAEKKKADYYSDMIKISIAAVVTLLLVGVCAIAELTMKLRIRQRVRRSTVVARDVTHHDDELLKKHLVEKESRA